MGLPQFGQMRDMYQMAKKAKQMQKEMKNLEIEANSPDGLIHVVVSGEMKVSSINIAEELLSPDKKRELEMSLKETIVQAMSRAQSESAARMQPLLKDMNFPGM